MESIIIHTKNKKQIKVFESLAMALGIGFEKKKDKSPYNPDFVKKIRKSEKDFEEGRVTIIKKGEVEQFIDSL